MPERMVKRQLFGKKAKVLVNPRGYVIKKRHPSKKSKQKLSMDKIYRRGIYTKLSEV